MTTPTPGDLSARHVEVLRRMRAAVTDLLALGPRRAHVSLHEEDAALTAAIAALSALSTGGEPIAWMMTSDAYKRPAEFYRERPAFVPPTSKLIPLYITPPADADVGAQGEGSVPDSALWQAIREASDPADLLPRIIALLQSPREPADVGAQGEAVHKAILDYIADMTVLTGPQWAALTNFVNAQFRRLAAPAAGKGVDDAMVERALVHRAFREDGALWPDAYSDEEQKIERENMRAMLAVALKAGGPGAYCRACQNVGMSNCQHFDECSGATCITCHRPFNEQAALTRQPVAGDGWRPIESAPRDGTEILVYDASTGDRYVTRWTTWVDGFGDQYTGWIHPDAGELGPVACEPSCWQPLPTGPAQGDGEVGS